MTRRLGPKSRIRLALAAVNRRIAAFASQGGLYARGLSGEGYNGGYRDALSDVLLVINGCVPNRNQDWLTEEEKQ